MPLLGMVVEHVSPGRRVGPAAEQAADYEQEQGERRQGVWAHRGAFGRQAADGEGDDEGARDDGCADVLRDQVRPRTRPELFAGRLPSALMMVRGWVQIEPIV